MRQAHPCSAGSVVAGVPVVVVARAFGSAAVLDSVTCMVAGLTETLTGVGCVLNTGI